MSREIECWFSLGVRYFTLIYAITAKYLWGSEQGSKFSVQYRCKPEPNELQHRKAPGKYHTCFPYRTIECDQATSFTGKIFPGTQSIGKILNTCLWTFQLLTLVIKIVKFDYFPVWILIITYKSARLLNHRYRAYITLPRFLYKVLQILHECSTLPKRLNVLYFWLVIWNSIITSALISIFDDYDCDLYN